ncbi:MAG TPA: hypothetical protein VJP45_13980 [Candidatus Limnocylindria bacterium]|nr:hypothetical protein [Candidatus Limnocylindria bacterium]
MEITETPEQKQRKADEAVQLVLGVALIAFAIIVAAALLTMRVTEVLSHPY